MWQLCGLGRTGSRMQYCSTVCGLLAEQCQLRKATVRLHLTFSSEKQTILLRIMSRSFFYSFLELKRSHAPDAPSVIKSPRRRTHMTAVVMRRAPPGLTPIAAM